MIETFLSVAFSAFLLGAVTYVMVWGLHNFELTSDTIMIWADKQETFLQKMISCPVCLTVQLSVATSSLHCLAFGFGLWRWILLTALTCLMALWLVRTRDPLST